MKKNDSIKSLQEDITFAQLEKIDKSLKEKIGFKRKLAHLSSILLITFFTLLIMANNPSKFTFYFCASSILLINMGKIIYDYIKMSNITEKNNDEYQDEDLDKNNETTLLDLNDFSLANEEDFYSDKMKEYINHENDEEDKYEETLKIQNARSNLKIYKKSEEPKITKENIIERIMYELDAYRLGTNLPPIEISSKDWQIYFDSLYDLLINKNNINEFYDITSRLLRITLSNSLINNSSNITIKNFVDNLKYMGTKYNFFQISLCEKEISNLQVEILDKVRRAKIIKLQR